MERIECSVWNNGASGWGIKVLGGPAIRQRYFRRDLSPVLVEVDGSLQQMNVNKKSFWTQSCGELIHKSLREWKDRHQLETGDRVSLDVIESFRRFKLRP
jgi:hypothetical protein